MSRTLLHCPDDVLYLVAGFLSDGNAGSLACTCTRLASLSKRPEWAIVRAEMCGQRPATTAPQVWAAHPDLRLVPFDRTYKTFKRAIFAAFDVEHEPVLQYGIWNSGQLGCPATPPGYEGSAFKAASEESYESVPCFDIFYYLFYERDERWSEPWNHSTDTQRAITAFRARVHDEYGTADAYTRRVFETMECPSHYRDWCTELVQTACFQRRPKRKRRMEQSS